jgi:hypothetical protein
LLQLLLLLLLRLCALGMRSATYIARASL